MHLSRSLRSAKSCLAQVGGINSGLSFTFTPFGRSVSDAVIYDAASQLSAISHELSAIPFSSFSYTYDKVGNRTTLSTLRSSLTVNGTVSYMYDDLYRLIDATNPIPANPNETFTYDALGNRQNNNAMFNPANRLTEDDDFTYIYDNNGNLTQRIEKGTSTTTTYMYDAQNQLIQINLPNGDIAQYKYDGLGRRIEKDFNGTITRYVYDNEDILFEFDGSNNLVARYHHGPGIDEPLIMERDINANGSFESNEIFYYHTDGLGSIVDITDNTGTPVKSYAYDSFGNIVDEIGTLLNPYAYTAREFDVESGLNYYRRRFYDPTIGRFLQEDPIPGFLSFPSSQNKYPYTFNNPINFVDPTGEVYQQVFIFCAQKSSVCLTISTIVFKEIIDWIEGRNVSGKPPSPTIDELIQMGIDKIQDFPVKPQPRSDGNCPPGKRMTSRGCRDAGGEPTPSPTEPPEPQMCPINGG